MKYIVFLDIDGVFTSTRVQLSSYNTSEMWNTFDPVAINFMNRIHDKVDGVSFVLISTWKEGMANDDSVGFHWILSSFRNAGFRGNFPDKWRTNPEDARHFKNRAFEIKSYLTDYAEGHKDYIIFDDTDYDFDKVLGKKRLIRTDSHDGLQTKHIKNALSMIGGWDPK